MNSQQPLSQCEALLYSKQTGSLSPDSSTHLQNHHVSGDSSVSMKAMLKKLILKPALLLISSAVLGDRILIPVC